MTDRIELPGPFVEGSRDRKYDVRFGRKLEELEKRVRVLEAIVESL